MLAMRTLMHFYQLSNLSILHKRLMLQNLLLLLDEALLSLNAYGLLKLCC